MHHSLKACLAFDRRVCRQLIIKSSAIFSIVVVSHFAFAETTQIEQAQKPDLRDMTDATKAKSLLTGKPYGPVVKVLELMDQFNVDRKLERSLANLKKNKEALPYLSRLYEDLSKEAPEGDKGREPNTGYTRWKTVYLMGLLDDPKAIDRLSEIAQSPLPNAELAGDIAFANEYRIRLRAIASLERLKARGSLRRLHRAGGLLSKPAAVSLFELGEKVEGIKKIDGEKVIGPGDSKNYNVKEEDEARIKGSPRSDKHEEHKIVPKTESGKKDRQ